MYALTSPSPFLARNCIWVFFGRHFFVVSHLVSTQLKRYDHDYHFDFVAYLFMELVSCGNCRLCVCVFFPVFFCAMHFFCSRTMFDYTFDFLIHRVVFIAHFSAENGKYSQHSDRPPSIIHNMLQ